MNPIRKFIASLCAVLFVVSGVPALFTFNIERSAFDSRTYKQAFGNLNLYERMPGILAEALYTSNAENPNADPYLKAMTVDDWQATIVSLLPPEELKAIADNALDSLFDYLNGKTDSAAILLTPLKSHLVGPAGMQVARQILRTQPNCTPEQLFQIGLGFISGNVTLCNPPDEMMNLMTPLIESQLQVMIVAFPDQITLISSAQNNTSQDDPRAKLNLVRALMKIMPVFPLLFLFSLTAFAVRGLVDWLEWWGWPLMITGAGSALLALIGSPLLGLMIQRVLQNQGARFIPTILLSTLRETVSTVSQQILKPVLIEGALLAVLGMGMVLTKWFIVFRNRQRT